MKYIFTGKNLQVSEDMKVLAQKKLSKLEKFFNENQTCKVTFSHLKNDQVVEVTFDLPGGAFIRAEETDKTLQSALDRVVDRLTRQIRKHKTKLEKKYKGNQTIRFDNISYEEPVPEEEDLEKVVKRKTFDLRPMSVEEAALQMELLGHNFFCFMNSETDQINVIYKRKSSGLGLLEPEN